VGPEVEDLRLSLEHAGSSSVSVNKTISTVDLFMQRLWGKNWQLLIAQIEP
jgi:hypothetical protein